jgi:hypothetical protein
LDLVGRLDEAAGQMEDEAANDLLGDVAEVCLPV